MTNDDDLRQLFGDATSEITPSGTLEEIRDRTAKADPSVRRWFLPSMAAAAAMALVVGGAFWATRDDDPGSSNVAASPAAPIDATIFYVGDGARGPRLFSEVHTIQPGAGGPGLSAAREAVLGTPLDRDYRSVWSRGTLIQDVTLAGDTITIGFADASAADPLPEMNAAEAQAGIDALVRTVRAAYATTAAVEFTMAGEPATRVLGNDTSTPSVGGSDEDVLALVSISDLANGATVEPGRLTVKGFAATFEANVAWELLVGGDAVIDSGFTTAAEGGVLSPYEFTTNIPLEGPGTYTLVVHDTDESGEGRPVNQDTKEIVVE